MPTASRVFITGGAGFIGARLVGALRGRGAVVIAPDVDVLDLLDVAALRDSIAEAAPDVVVHLAAISHVPTCAADPALAIQTNLGGTAGLLEAMRGAGSRARLIFASTAQVYAAPAAGERTIVMTETRAIAPQNLYARTKWDAELLIDDACRRDGLHATVLRLFNHTHRSQSPRFFLPHLYRAISDGLRTVPVGNLHVSRDVGSVQDLTAAFIAAIDRDAVHDVFNVCSGTAKQLATLASGIASRLGAEVTFVTDPERVRPDEPEVLLGSHARFTEATGWLPTCVTEAALLDAFLVDD